MLRRFAGSASEAQGAPLATAAIPSRNGAREPPLDEGDSRWEVQAYATPKSKRFLDVGIASLALAVLWPVWLLTIGLIKLDSPGPALLRQRRVGHKGRLFQFYKFRTMRSGTEEGDYGRIPKGDLENCLLSPPGRDPRVTRIGWALRKTTVDELPQLLNIIKGEMSLVGPRPDIPEIVEAWPPAFRQRHQAKPGMTGLAQVNGRSDLTHYQKIRYDLAYARYHPLSRDIAVLMKTIGLVLSKKGAR